LSSGIFSTRIDQLPPATATLLPPLPPLLHPPPPPLGSGAPQIEHAATFGMLTKVHIWHAPAAAASANGGLPMGGAAFASGSADPLVTVELLCATAAAAFTCKESPFFIKPPSNVESSAVSSFGGYLQHDADTTRRGRSDIRKPKNNQQDTYIQQCGQTRIHNGNRSSPLFAKKAQFEQCVAGASRPAQVHASRLPEQRCKK
jgi:hypothetical protein